MSTKTSSADCSAAVEPESKWTTTESKLRKATGTIMNLYTRTELLWVALICANVVLQACKTNQSSQRFLNLLGESSIDHADSSPV